MPKAKAPAKVKAKKKVLIVYNGGTIGMKRSDAGYGPESGYLQAQMEAIPAFTQPSLPEWQIVEQRPLIDSANMHPDRWWGIAQDIADHYGEYDGFVVLHGTDTMAYTASALPFMLQGLRKPVILTGSQIPLCEIRNDAQENLITSLLLAADYAVPEVCLYFGGRLMRGCRSVKIDAKGFQAFGSPNYPLLGQAGIDIEIFWERVKQPVAEPSELTLYPLNRATVAALRLFPGISASVLENMLRPPLRGLVLEAYGIGNGPAMDQVFLRVLRQACERGIVIVDCTQCIMGRVDLDGYATGRALADAGVVPGLDLTTEAALAKLYYLLSHHQDPDSIRAAMQQNLCGELTP